MIYGYKVVSSDKVDVRADSPHDVPTSVLSGCGLVNPKPSSKWFSFIDIPNLDKFTAGIEEEVSSQHSNYQLVRLKPQAIEMAVGRVRISCESHMSEAAEIFIGGIKQERVISIEVSKIKKNADVNVNVVYLV